MGFIEVWYCYCIIICYIIIYCCICCCIIGLNCCWVPYIPPKFGMNLFHIKIRITLASPFQPTQVATAAAAWELGVQTGLPTAATHSQRCPGSLAAAGQVEQARKKCHFARRSPGRSAALRATGLNSFRPKDRQVRQFCSCSAPPQSTSGASAQCCQSCWSQSRSHLPRQKQTLGTRSPEPGHWCRTCWIHGRIHLSIGPSKPILSFFSLLRLFWQPPWLSSPHLLS